MCLSNGYFVLKNLIRLQADLKFYTAAVDIIIISYYHLTVSKYRQRCVKKSCRSVSGTALHPELISEN